MAGVWDERSTETLNALLKEAFCILLGLTFFPTAAIECTSRIEPIDLLNPAIFCLACSFVDSSGTTYLSWTAPAAGVVSRLGSDL